MFSIEFIQQIAAEIALGHSLNDKTMITALKAFKNCPFIDFPQTANIKYS